MAGKRPRDRIGTALTSGSRKDTPAVVPYMGLMLRDHWDEITDRPWWTMQYGSFADRCAVLQTMAQATGSEWVPVGECESRSAREAHRVERRQGQPFLIDGDTAAAKLLERPPVGGRQYQSSQVRTRVRTLTDVAEQLPIVTADEREAAGRLDYIRYARGHLDGDLCLVAPVAAPLWRTHGYFGFNTMMTNLVEAPELVEALTDRLAQDAIERVAAYARTGVDCVWIEDCLTSRDLISPGHYERYQVPGLTRIADAIRRGGMTSVYYYCGDPWDRLDAMVATGVDAIGLEESKKGCHIDIDDVDNVVAGRAALLGNLDAIGLLPHGSPAELRDEVQRQLDVGRRRGRFVASLGSPVTPGTPMSRVRLYTDLVRELSE